MKLIVTKVKSRNDAPAFLGVETQYFASLYNMITCVMGDAKYCVST